MVEVIAFLVFVAFVIVFIEIFCQEGTMNIRDINRLSRNFRKASRLLELMIWAISGLVVKGVSYGRDKKV